jgi:ubiquitin thioesterase protein OTUB1
MYEDPHLTIPRHKLDFNSYAMSISKPWNHHFGSHPFPAKQNLNLHRYRDAISSSLLSPVALSLPLPSYSHPHPPTMSNMNALSADEMERFQKLSNSYEPDVQVCLSIY